MLKNQKSNMTDPITEDLLRRAREQHSRVNKTLNSKNTPFQKIKRVIIRGKDAFDDKTHSFKQSFKTTPAQKQALLKKAGSGLVQARNQLSRIPKVPLRVGLGLGVAAGVGGLIGKAVMDKKRKKQKEQKL